MASVLCRCSNDGSPSLLAFALDFIILSRPSLLSVYRRVSNNPILFARRPQRIACRLVRLQLPSKMAPARRKVVQTVVKKATGKQYTHVDATETRQNWHGFEGGELIVELVVKTCRTSRTG